MRFMIVTSVTLLLVSGCGTAPAGEEAMLLDYLAEQAEATSAVLDGDESHEALERVNEINAQYIRFYDGEPGDPDGEWVYPHGEWLSSRGNCYDHLDESGMAFADAQVLCNATLGLYSVSSDLDYWFDESNAEDDESWEQDRPVELEETREAVTEAEELL